MRTQLERDTPRALEFFEQYYERFIVAFPSLDTRSTFEECLRDLRDRRFNIIVVVRQDQIVGGVHVWEFGQFGLEEHIWTDPAMRGQRIGEALDFYVSNLLYSRGAIGMVSELLDPYRDRENGKVTNDGRQSESFARLAFFERLGRLWIDAPYVQPALRAEARSIDNMILTIQPLQADLQELSVTTYLSILRDYFSAITGGQNIEEVIQLHLAQLELWPLATGMIPFRSMEYFRQTNVI